MQSIWQSRCRLINSELGRVNQNVSSFGEMARSSSPEKCDAISRPDAHRMECSKSWKDVLNTAKPARVQDEQATECNMSRDANAKSVQCEVKNRSDECVHKVENDDRQDDEHEEAAELEDQVRRQLDLNVRAAEFSPGFGCSPGQQGIMHLPDGMTMLQRSMPFGSVPMRGPMPNNAAYEMMQYYEQMYNNQQFPGGHGTMQLQQPDVEESAHTNAGVANGLGSDVQMNSAPMTAMHRGSHGWQAVQNSAQGPGGLMQQQYFNSYHGAMNMMPPSMAAYGPHAHNMYVPYMANMQVTAYSFSCMHVKPGHNLVCGYNECY